jgi:hypothetical protein
MHTKINTHQNDSNSSTHGFWSKTKLDMQHIHLELLKILSYAFAKKIRHISRINIYVKHKIMVKSPEVGLCIKRLYPEVEHKNIFIFSYKNHLDRFNINTK